MLATADFTSPLFWAVLIGWIMTVVLHEFAHGLVAHLGGDYTIRQRGGLTLNPLQYVHPVTSILLPAVFLMIGGIPLPGGATYIRTDLLRSRLWESAVAAAGPVTNFTLFLALAYAVHPAAGWVNPGAPVVNWTNAQIFVAALALLQLLAVLLNLLPIPPLDGFNILSPFLPPDLKQRMMTPPLSTGLFILLLFLLLSGRLWPAFGGIMQAITGGLNLPYESLFNAMLLALFGRS
jgi:Zn-dependent protease